MKKFIVLPVMLILLFCGCSKSNETEPILDNISFVAHIEYDDEKYVCNTTVIDNVFTLNVIEPEEVTGLVLTLDTNGVSVDYKGIEFNPDITELPQGAIAQTLFDVFADVSKKQSLEYKDGNCEIEGKVKDKEYTFLFAPSGLPISLEIDDLDFKVEFREVTII